MGHWTPQGFELRGAGTHGYPEGIQVVSRVYPGGIQGVSRGHQGGLRGCGGAWTRDGLREAVVFPMSALLLFLYPVVILAWTVIEAGAAGGWNAL